MNTASPTGQNARDALREARDAAADASSHFERDLQALRDDFKRLAGQVADLLTETGNVAWRHAKSGVNDAVSDAQNKGRDAASAVRDVSENFVGALDESIKARPYTTLALVAGLAFLFGAAWRR